MHAYIYTYIYMHSLRVCLSASTHICASLNVSVGFCVCIPLNASLCMCLDLSAPVGI